MDNVLGSLAMGGKAIFVDYAKPVWWQFLRYPLFVFNRLYRPFCDNFISKRYICDATHVGKYLLWVDFRYWLRTMF